MLLSSPRRPRWQQRSGGSPSSRPIGGRGRRSTRNKVYAIVAVFIFIFCAFNIIRLHNRITGGSLRWSESNNDADDNIAVGEKVEVTNVPTPSISAQVPTIVNTTSFWPTTHTWSPTSFHNQTSSWLPTLSTEDEHILNFGQNFIDERYNSHPRVVCFFQDEIITTELTTERNNKGTSCNSIAGIRFNLYSKKKGYESIPLEAKEYKGGDKEEEEVDKVNEYIETDTCKYPNNQATAIAPPTCNEIHSLGFDVNMFQTNYKHPSHQRMSSIKYVTMGGAKCVWKVDPKYGVHEESFIFKSHKQSRFVKRHFYGQNQIDALISGGLGNTQLSRILSVGSSSVNDIGTPDSDWNHVLPMYHYCGLANIVPFADGNLEEWIDANRHSGQRLDPADTLRLALQAARGLYQAHMYWNGRPSYVHADLNPSQFLVFIPKSDSSKNSTLPIIQINDFNQGRFLTRSVTSNKTCPFRSCSKNLRGNRYHTPERFQGCVDQNEGIDSFSLGGVFFNLLTNGFDPYYDHRNYYTPIKKGELPHVPRRLDLDHPAYDALIDVMYKCMASELNNRPSSLEVVRMLIEKMHQIGI